MSIARGGDESLLEAVADRPAEHHAADLEQRHQRDDERRGADGIAERFLHVGDRVHVDRAHYQECETVAQ
jgi:hypothetical protein